MCFCAERNGIRMTIKDLARKIFPVSARSFHRSMGYLDNQLHGIRAELDSLSYGTIDQRAFYLVCEAGYPNFGDELIAREWLRYLAATHPDIPVIMDCARPGPATCLLRKEHPHVSVVDTLYRLTVENVYAEQDVHAMSQSAKYIHSALNDEGIAARYSSGIRLLHRDVRAVHYLGGGYMNGNWFTTLTRLELAFWCAEQERHIPLIATGAGLAPLYDEDGTLEYAQSRVSKFDAVVVRDEVSQSLLKCSGNVRLGPDDCFVNGLTNCYSAEGDLPDVMVCIQTDLVDDVDVLYRHVLEVLIAWDVDFQATIGVVECVPYTDFPILKVLESAGYKTRLFPAADLLEQGFPARPGQRWLTTRYHPHILAAARGCEGSYIVVNKNYYGTKHDAVQRMGSHWTQSQIGRPVPQPGAGFTDMALPHRYADQIRESASILYGFTPIS